MYYYLFLIFSCLSPRRLTTRGAASLGGEGETGGGVTTRVGLDVPGLIYAAITFRLVRVRHAWSPRRSFGAGLSSPVSFKVLSSLVRVQRSLRRKRHICGGAGGSRTSTRRRGDGPRGGGGVSTSKGRNLLHIFLPSPTWQTSGAFQARQRGRGTPGGSLLSSAETFSPRKSASITASSLSVLVKHIEREIGNSPPPGSLLS